MDTRFRGRLLAIAALGFAGRAVFALTSGSDGLVRAGDPRFFHQTANLLADGHGYISPVFWFANGSSAAATEHPPLWSAVLALFSVLGGRSVHAHQLVGCAVGAATVVCAGAIGRRLRGNRVGLLAAAGCAAFPVFVAMDGSLMSEPLYALCMALVVLAALRLVAEPSLRRSAVLGLAIGLCTLVRSEAILLVALAGAPVALMLRERRGLRVAVVGAVAILTIAPWCVRNSLELDHPMLVSSEDGSVLAGANCARTYSGYSLGYWRADCLPRAHDRNAATASVRLRGVGLRYARDHAHRLPAVAAVRVLRTFGLWQPQRLVYFAEGRKLPGRLPAVAAGWAILALAVAGGFVLGRAERRRLLLLLAPVALAVITSLIAFGYPRFRYAADVSLILLAAIAVEWAVARYGSRATHRTELAAAPSRRTRPATAKAAVVSWRTFLWPNREPSDR